MLTLCRVFLGLAFTLAGIALGLGLLVSGRPGVAVFAMLGLVMLGAVLMPEMPQEIEPD